MLVTAGRCGKHMHHRSLREGLWCSLGAEFHGYEGKRKIKGMSVFTSHMNCDISGDTLRLSFLEHRAILVSERMPSFEERCGLDFSILEYEVKITWAHLSWTLTLTCRAVSSGFYPIHSSFVLWWVSLRLSFLKKMFSLLISAYVCKVCECRCHSACMKIKWQLSCWSFLLPWDPRLELRL